MLSAMTMIIIEFNQLPSRRAAQLMNNKLKLQLKAKIDSRLERKINNRIKE